MYRTIGRSFLFGAFNCLLAADLLWWIFICTNWSHTFYHYGYANPGMVKWFGLVGLICLTGNCIYQTIAKTKMNTRIVSSFAIAVVAALRMFFFVINQDGFSEFIDFFLQLSMEGVYDGIVN